MLLDELLDRRADPAGRRTDPLAVGASKEVFEGIVESCLLVDLLDGSTDGVDVPGRDRNSVLAQKVQQARPPGVVLAMPVNGVQAVAEQAAEQQEKGVGGAIHIGQEHQSRRQWMTVQIARRVHDEKAREMHVGQLAVRYER